MNEYKKDVSARYRVLNLKDYSKLHQQMQEIVSNKKEEEIQESMKLYDKETKKKLSKYQKDIEHYRGLSEYLMDRISTKKDALPNYPPIFTTENKRTLKKKKKKRNQRTKKKKVKRSLTQSLKSFLGLKG